MVRTRVVNELLSDDAGDNDAGGSGAGGAAPPPPPPIAPNLAEVLAAQAQLFQALVQNATQGGHRAPAPQQGVTYSDFLATRPPIFSGAKDPLEVDNWLCTIESKFGLLEGCTEV